jgi:hypothetical protein
MHKQPRNGKEFTRRGGGEGSALFAHGAGPGAVVFGPSRAGLVRVCEGCLSRVSSLSNPVRIKPYDPLLSVLDITLDNPGQYGRVYIPMA